MQAKSLLNWQKRALGQPQFRFYRALVSRYPAARVYLVGGVVRDFLLGRPEKDLDFVVTGVPEAKLITFLRAYGQIDLVGRTFGVLKFTPKGKHGSEAFDIALPRLDQPGRGTGAYRDVRVVRRANLAIEDDLVRRDFTVNALAWDMLTQRLIDPSGGLKDLREKTLRTVGDPAKRFAEDFSRMLRGLRFAIELGFRLEPATARVLKGSAHHLNDERRGVIVVPREVVAKELLKTFYADPVAALRLYDGSGVLKVLLPEMLAMKTCPQPKPYHTEGSVWRHTVLALQALRSRQFRARYAERPDAELIMAVLWHDLGKPYTLKTPHTHGVNRIRFDGHDVVGGAMAREISERLKLASPPSGTSLHVHPEHLEWLLQHHLLLLHDNVQRMKLTTIEKYFVRHPLAVKLQQLILVDSLATIPPSGRPVLRHLTALSRVLKKMEGQRGQLPAPLLAGDAIMTLLHIPSGPAVGMILRRLREQQLLGAVKTKAEARAFVRRAYADL